MVINCRTDCSKGRNFDNVSKIGFVFIVIGKFILVSIDTTLTAKGNRVGQEVSGYVCIHDLSPITDGVLRDVDELRDQDVGDSLAAQEEDQQQEGFEGELATREHTSRSDAG